MASANAVVDCAEVEAEQRMRVFVSSTFKDLAALRAAAAEAVEALGLECELVGTLSGLSDSEIARVCAEKARGCDACILIVAFSQGSSAPGDPVAENIAAYHMPTFTAIELKAAIDGGLPVLAYLLKKTDLEVDVEAEAATRDGGIQVSQGKERIGQFREDILKYHLVRRISRDVPKFKESLTVDLLNLTRAIANGQSDQ